MAVVTLSDKPRTRSNTIAERPNDHVPRYGAHATEKAFVIMFGLLLFAVLAAMGHHQFYAYLDNLEVSSAPVSQRWVIRIGNAFAFLVKLVLVAAMVVAYSQGFWFYVRRNSIQISSLDALFGALYNPLWFLKIVRQAVWLFAFASISWLLPLCAIFSPGTLTGAQFFS